MTRLPEMQSEFEALEIREYLRRFESMSAEDRLRVMGQLRDFFYRNMPPEGRKFFEGQRLRPP